MPQTFNAKIYGHMVRQVVDNTEDYLWLCNQMGKLYRKVEKAGCVDNARVCLADENGKMTDKYRRTQEAGCCGSTDEKVTNAKTGNSFWIGFNYGH